MQPAPPIERAAVAAEERWQQHVEPVLVGANAAVPGGDGTNAMAWALEPTLPVAMAPRPEERWRDHGSSLRATNAAWAAQREDEASSRQQLGIRSPREVQVLLSSIESREANLRAKVQQMAEEKTAQQHRLEEELRSLQRANAQMEAELRMRRVDDEARAPAAVALELAHSRPRSPRDDRSEPSMLMRPDAREELQQQLAEIRGEVARCASALCADEPLPTSEVADIRQQLSALSNEVMQTSQALLTPAPGFPGRGAPRDSEIYEVRRQLEGLQGQVSRAMYAALSRPGVPSQQDVPRNDAQGEEVFELRGEVARLRAELSQAGRQTAGSAVPSRARPQAPTVDLKAQLEELRRELGGIAQPSQPLPPHVPSLPLEPPRASQPTPEAPSLQERLSWLRAEVAKVLQDPRYAQDSAPPEIQNRLGALLRELQDLRQGAEAVAAVSGGSPVPRRQAPAAAYVMGQPLQSMAHPRSSTPLRHLRPDDASVANGGRFFEAAPTRGTPMDWAAANSLHVGQPPMAQPIVGVQTSPLLVCPHVAADLAGERGVGDMARYANRYADRYVDREHLAADAVMRGSGNIPYADVGSATPTLGMPTPGAPTVLSPGGVQHSVSQMSASPLNASSALSGHLLGAGSLNGSLNLSAAEASSWRGERGPSWAGQTGPALMGAQGPSWPTPTHSLSGRGTPSGSGRGTPCGGSFAEGPSTPAAEPMEVAPQGNMWRPMRSKISR